MSAAWALAWNIKRDPAATQPSTSSRSSQRDGSRAFTFDSLNSPATPRSCSDGVWHHLSQEELMQIDGDTKAPLSSSKASKCNDVVVADFHRQNMDAAEGEPGTPLEELFGLLGRSAVAPSLSDAHVEDFGTEIHAAKRGLLDATELFGTHIAAV